MLAAVVVGIGRHHGVKPNMHDIEDPVSIGKTNAEVEEVGSADIVMEAAGVGEEVKKDPLDTVEMEEDDPDEMD